MIISMFKLHILLFYKAKSSILNIHGIQCYSYANIVLFICICESEYTFNKYIHRPQKYCTSNVKDVKDAAESLAKNNFVEPRSTHTESYVQAS